MRNMRRSGASDEATTPDVQQHAQQDKRTRKYVFFFPLCVRKGLQSVCELLTCINGNTLTNRKEAFFANHDNERVAVHC